MSRVAACQCRYSTYLRLLQSGSSWGSCMCFVCMYVYDCVVTFLLTRASVYNFRCNVRLRGRASWVWLVTRTGRRPGHIQPGIVFVLFYGCICAPQYLQSILMVDGSVGAVYVRVCWCHPHQFGRHPYLLLYSFRVRYVRRSNRGHTAGGRSFFFLC